MKQFSKFITWRYLWLSMFRASYRPSSETYNCTRSLCFCIRYRLKDVVLLVIVGQNILPNHDQQHYILQPAMYAKPEAVGAVVCSWWWAVWRLKCVEPQITSSNKLGKLLHLVGWFYKRLYEDAWTHKHQIENMVTGPNTDSFTSI